MSSAVVAAHSPSRRQLARGGVSRTALGILGALVALVAALLVCVTPAQAATDYAKYLVGDTVSPTGTTINLFDYWVAGENNDNSANINRYGANDDTGINAGHSLKFNGGESAASVNKWTGSATPRNFVSKTLANGYPQISSGSESLAYLFDTSSQTGKASYYNVMGLLRSQDGYFYYDSTQNFASYDKQTNSFDVYNTWGVKRGGAGGDVNGQFFPFNSASDVFSGVDASGQPSQKSVTCDANSMLNHHFGLTMETQFTQPENGQVIYNGQAQDMTYEFAGDDDVWVYIDGVLVGDLGGIHDRATLNINFNTGDVQVNGSSPVSLRSLYSAAGREEATDWAGNTYKASTRHTLKFFYLERGAYASNMKLKFNLSEQPVSEVKKADQNGNPVAGAQFSLFSADENYNYTENDLLATGTTSDTGTMQLIKSDGSPISFDNECDINQRKHYVLREVTPPTGYRTGLTAGDKELHLDYVKATDKGRSVTGGALVSPNQGVDSEDTPIKDASGNSITVSRQWISGGYATASETITAKYDLSKIKDHKDNSLGTGLTFAVVLRNGKVGSAEDVNKDSNWFAVKGNDLYGYSLCEDHSVAGAVEAAHDAEKNGYSTVFTPSSTGFYEATLSYLPGDISTYAFMMSQEDAAAGKAQYTVAVYHTTASSLGDATVDNTARVDSSNFRRKFSSRLNLTNVQNRLWVQKVDETGAPVAGAQFELYEAKDVTVGKDGSYTINEGAQPYDTATTKEETIYYGLKGGVAFPQGSDQHKPLVKGIYYLRESKAPDGYTRNETITKVYVDDSGVYVDAGKTDDGVRSMSGPGSLLSLLSQFGRTTGLDGTLAYVRGTLQSATVDGAGNLAWNRGVSSSVGIKSNTPMTDGWMDMKYGGTLVDGKPVLKYVTDNDSGSLPIIYADTGINRMRLVQNGTKTTNGDNLGDLQINQLFTQASGVEYTDARVASLEVTKQVTADGGLTAPGAAFFFRFELPESDEGYDACVFNADGTAAGDAFKLKNGDVHRITAGQTIHVFGLSAGDHYKVEEVTTQAQASEGDLLATLGTFLTQSGEKSALSNGFSLVLRIQGGQRLEGEGNSIEGRLAAASGDQTPEANKLVFVNRYSVTSTTLPASKAFWAKKVLSGRDWADGDSFTLRLQAADGAPMPEGAQTDEAGAAYFDVTVSKANKDANVSFGDITYAAPGTYAYSIYELADQQDGMSFSNASYEVKVTVEDQHDGTLKVTGVSMTKKTDDAGASVPAASASVADKVATFTNTYNDYETSVSLVANKSYVDKSGANPLVDGMFAFKLEAVGGYGSDSAAFDPKTIDKTISPAMPEGTTDGVFTTTNDASGNVKFRSISLTAAKDAGKTYVYRLTEVDADQPGYTYDGTKYYVVVRNHRNGGGINVEYLYNKVLPDSSVVALGRDTVPAFSNSYDAESVTSDPIAGIKTLSGRDWRGGNGETFSFVYFAADAQTSEAVRSGSVVLPDPAEGQVTGVTGDPATKDIDFGQTGIKFKRPGTYTFGVSERSSSGESAGLTYDAHVSKVTYVVSDLDSEGNHTGKLTWTVSYDNSFALTESDRSYAGGVAFTNTYHAEVTFAGVDLTKTMRGKALDEGAYKFKVSGLAYNGYQTSVEQAESLVTNPAAGEGQAAHVTVNGSKIFSRTLTEQDLGRVYAYRIHEENDGDGSGYKYDTLNAGDAIVLVKAYLDYSAGSDLGKLNYRVTVLKGQAVADQLDAAGGDANIFTSEKIGELIEAAKKDSGLYAVQYDSARAADAAATPTVDFVNEYGITQNVPVSTDTLFGKKLVGRDWKAGDAFTFSIAADAASAANTPMPSSTTTTVASATAKDGDIVRFGFGSITFDAAGTYIYDVSETGEDAAGITLDRNVAKLTIHVTDNGDGTLSVSKSSVVVESGIFTNTYTSELNYNAAGGVWLTKTLNGRAMTDGQFTFVLVAQDKASADRLGIDLNQGQTLSAPAAAAGKASAEVDVLAGHSLTFTQTDAGKTYSYRLTEVTPSAAAPGYSYDADSRYITIRVTDNGDGTITAKTTVTGGGQDQSSECTSGQQGTSRLVIPFVNSYQATGKLGGEGSAKIEATKELSGRELEAGEFKFEVVETVDGREKVVSQGTNDAEGNITFDAISYTQDEVGEHQYTVREVKNDLPAGVTGVATEFLITVKVTDKGDGTLATSVGYPEGTSSLTFKNAYGSGSTVEVPMAGSKAYETPQGEGYNAPSIDGKFEFTLTGKDGAPMPAGSVGGTKVVKNVNGSVDFGSISYQMSDVNGAPGRTKTFTYTIAETGGEVEGVTRDASKKIIKVTIKDNGNGTLSASVVDVTDGANAALDPGALKFAFTNTYTPSSVESSVTDEGGISVTKELTGRKLETDEFTFRLIDQATGEDAVAAAKNDAQGKIVFGAITYTEPGTHYYSLVEEKGSAGGVTFDLTPRTVRVTVTDDGAGSLVATTELLDAEGNVADDAAVRFNNSYVPTEGSARIIATKVLSGSTLTEGQFSFELLDADGNVLQTAKNAADGSVTFDELTYGAADAGKTYVYHVREVNDGQANVTYDSAVRSFSVAVADDGQGHITAAVSGADDLTFTNTYHESGAPEGPGGEQAPELPNTGDQSASLPLLGGLAGVGVVALLAALVVRRRRP